MTLDVILAADARGHRALVRCIPACRSLLVNERPAISGIKASGSKTYKGVLLLYSRWCGLWLWVIISLL